ncbi:MAG: DUF4173 domain-containing protein [Phycisphaeraceae bacterium]
MSNIPAIRRAPFLLALTLALVALADQFFYHAPVPPGWTAGCFASLLLIAILWRSPRIIRHWPGRILMLCAALIALAMLIEPGGLEYTLALLILTALAFTGRLGWSDQPALWLGRYLRLFFAWLRPLRDMRTARRWQRAHHPHRPSLRRFALRWAVPLALTALFLLLFRQANPVIENQLHHLRQTLGDWLTHLTDYIAPLRILFWCCTAIAAWSLLRLRSRRRQTAPRPVMPRYADRPVAADLVIRCLILFNALFAVQTVMDLLYLWQHAQLPAGLTYAQYAHRGTYPLVVTALLAGLFVLVAFRKSGPAQTSAVARRLVYLWLAQNVWLMVSSIRRLSLYIDVFALSRWRIAAAVWMGVVGLALMLTVLRIILNRDNAWLVRVNAVAALAVCIVCMFIPFDRIIADFNVRHCREMNTGEVALDVPYLQHLGPSSLPALLWFADQNADMFKRNQARHAADALQTDLRQTLADWRGWTFRRAQLAPQ